jgi:hypothetical protein
MICKYSALSFWGSGKNTEYMIVEVRLHGNIMFIFNLQCMCHFFRMEDLTDPESIRQDSKCDRRISLYGYVRGAHLKYNSKVHLLGSYQSNHSLIPKPSTVKKNDFVLNVDICIINVFLRLWRFCARRCEPA